MFLNNKNKATDYWHKYEKGMSYIYSQNLIKKTNEHWNFFLGKQWEGLESGEERPVSMPFIYRDIMRKVTTIQSATMAVNYTNADGSSKYQELYEKLSSHFSLCWEKANEDELLRETIKDAAITGDGLQYFGSHDLEKVQRLDNTQVLYGDEAQTDIQKQPYIIVHRRELVQNVRKQAEMNGLSPEQIKLIRPDENIADTIGENTENESDTLEPTHKVTTLIYMEKIDGVVNVAKSTRGVVYEELHPIAIENADGTYGRGLTRYPIVKFSWENRPNRARGVSAIEVHQLIPCQIEANKTYVRRGIQNAMCAYQKLVYLEDRVNNPDDLMKVGSPIAIDGDDARSASQIVSYLQTPTISEEPRKYAEDLISTSQEISGSGDTTTGNIDLNRVAASAIVAVNEKAESMLDTQKAKRDRYVEDLAMLWAEMLIVYNPNGIEIIKEVEIADKNGMPIKQRIPVFVSGEELDQLNPRTRIDVSPDNSFTREASLQSLSNFVDKGWLTFKQFIKLVPDTAPIPKEDILALLEEDERKQQEQQAQMANAEIEQAKQQVAELNGQSEQM